MAKIDRIQDELDKPERTKFHQRLLEDTKALVEMSRSKMCEYYDKWDKNHDVFKGLMPTDKADKLASDRKEPQKMVVPTAYSQIMTFVAFCYMLYTQRERVFELVGVSEEDHDAAKVGEAILARDLDENDFELKLIQFLLDICRFHVGIIEITWVHEKRMMQQEGETGFARQLFGRVFGRHTTTQEVEVTSYLGNRLYNVSPFKFFPDTRLPISRFQEGEFVGVEDEFSYVSLKQLEHEGVVTGVSHVREISVDTLRNRRGDTRMSTALPVGRHALSNTTGQSRHPILVTKVQRNLIPSEFVMDDGEPLGPEEYPVKYVIWYANDDRIIKAEKLNYPHGRFTYEIGQFIPDQHDLVGLSFSETIDALQEVVSWFINSHITSVRKVISNFLIVDPSGVEMSDLTARNPVIRLKPSAANRGVERYVTQLAVQDVTARHLEDVKSLRTIIQETTGVSDNLLGQFHTGRRSATEARNVSSSTAARLKMLAAAIWKSGLKRTGRQMLDNLRTGLDEETIVRVVGLQRAQQGAAFKKVTKRDLQGSYDFEIFDGTLPSEKQFTAQALQDILVALIPNPQAAIALRLDPLKMLLEALELRGVRNPERFTLPAPVESGDNGRPQQPIEAGTTEGVPGPTGEPILPGGFGDLRA